MTAASGSQDSAEDPPEDAPAGVPEGAVTRQLKIVNKKGLHARASAKFVQCVEGFDADVKVTRGHETVGGTSIMGLMMLAAATGTTITVTAVGTDAEQAVAAIAALVGSKFGEDE